MSIEAGKNGQVLPKAWQKWIIDDLKQTKTCQSFILEDNLEVRERLPGHLAVPMPAPWLTRSSRAAAMLWMSSDWEASWERVVSRSKGKRSAHNGHISWTWPRNMRQEFCIRCRESVWYSMESTTDVAESMTPVASSPIGHFLIWINYCHYFGWIETMELLLLWELAVSRRWRLKVI